ncbi:MAG: ATP-dependent helicase HrpB [Polyangiaceae bacterium]
MSSLPIDSILPDIVSALARSRSLVIEAPPGAGKTTRVPRAMLDAGLLTEGEVLVREPRRLAARLAARRVAEELGESVGQRVGYTVRFEDQSSAATRIRYVTEGILTRRLLVDPLLEGTNYVILDEFHERHLHADVGLALLTRLQETVRPDLRIVAMSATLDAKPIAEYLGAKVVRSDGKLFPVAIEHLASPDDRPLASQVSSAVRRLVMDGLEGDILVFLPGANEIRRARETCEKLATDFDFHLVTLHGDLSPQEQDFAVQRADRRKVILSTNVAESSVTIEGVRAVIDSGLANIASHSSWSGLSTLRVEKISRASATQRAGRAGRLGPGRCLRLYAKSDFDTRPEHDVPEIQRADLSEVELALAVAGVRDLQWFDPPKEESVREARRLLTRLRALDGSGMITDTGRRMLEFGLHPRQARLLVEAESRGVGNDACVVAALLGERDIRVGGRARLEGPASSRFSSWGGMGKAPTERSDLLHLVDLFREAENTGFRPEFCQRMGLDPSALRVVSAAYGKLRRVLSRTAPRAPDTTRAYENALLLSILAAYPDRVARRVRAGGRTLGMAGGGNAELSETSTVRDAPWVVAVDARERRGIASMVHLASAIEPEWLIELFEEEIHDERVVRFDTASERVILEVRVTYDGLVLDSLPHAVRGTGEITEVLYAAAVAAGPHRFAPEGTLERWMARTHFLHGLFPDVPLVDAPRVKEALRAMCEGRVSFAEVRHDSLVDVLREQLGYELRDRIDRLAPERVMLPGGRFLDIHYEIGKPPWIESFLQDFFGQTKTPTVAGGRTPLVVHLWAPNRRAVQVTTDLEGFWTRHYAGIRKELQRKYPKHYWPEDPEAASPRLRNRTPKSG